MNSLLILLALLVPTTLMVRFLGDQWSFLGRWSLAFTCIILIEPLMDFSLAWIFGTLIGLPVILAGAALLSGGIVVCEFCKEKAQMKLDSL